MKKSNSIWINFNFSYFIFWKVKQIFHRFILLEFQTFEVKSFLSHERMFLKNQSIHWLIRFRFYIFVHVIQNARFFIGMLRIIRKIQNALFNINRHWNVWTNEWITYWNFSSLNRVNLSSWRVRFCFLQKCSWNS